MKLELKSYQTRMTKGTVRKVATPNYTPNTRTRARKIGLIIEKVAVWRSLYNGIFDKEGQFVRRRLEDSARLVGISKKSLDEYLSMLRRGRRYGFDFNLNKDKKIGVLRAFVRRHEEFCTGDDRYGD